MIQKIQLAVGNCHSLRFSREAVPKVQGLYIPKAYFISKLPGFSMKYLGLQLGRDPTPEDDDFDGWAVLRALKQDYGFIHNGSYRGNGLVITDDDGNERLVAIDLEDYYIRCAESRKGEGRT